MINNRSLVKVEDAKTLTYKYNVENVSFHNELLEKFEEELAEVDLFRILVHNSSESDLHNMIIAMRKNKVIFPHKHQKTESYHIMKGKALLIFFDNDGKIEKFMKLSLTDNIIIRAAKNKYHALIILSEYAIFHETRIGPFDRLGDSEFAPWIKANDEEFMKNILIEYKRRKNDM